MPSSPGGWYITTVLFWAIQVLWRLTPKVPMGPQTCWKSCATLPSRSWTLRIAIKFRPLHGRSCGVPAGPIWEKQTSQFRASSCKLGCDVWPVRLRCRVLFSNVQGPLSQLFSLTKFGNIERPKMWNRQLQMVGLAKVICKRSGNRLPSFCPHIVLFWSLQVLLQMTPKVPMGPQTCWKSCGNLPWRSWTLSGCRSNSVHCMADATGCQLDQFERSKLLKSALSCKLGWDVWPVRLDAVFVFSNVKGHCHGSFFANIWQHWKAKNVT